MGEGYTGRSRGRKEGLHREGKGGKGRRDGGEEEEERRGERKKRRGGSVSNAVVTGDEKQPVVE